MQRKLWVTLFLLVLVPAFLLAQSGKIRGTVVDAKTKEPLVGANVVVEATNMGASTDVDGSYLIISVPLGTYQMKFSYVGFRSITVSNVRVNANLTTEMNVELQSEDVQVQAVEVVAERPLINKSATGAVRVIDGDFFSKLPSRGINAALQLQPGVVERGGSFYIRGGRPDEAGFTLDGVGITDIYGGGRAVTITAEAVEQVQVQTGGFTAEFGGASAGIVRTDLRTGPERWKASALFETDNYTSANSKSLGGYSYGYRDITVTGGGPVLTNNLRVFASFQNTYYTDPAVRFWNGYSFKGVRMQPASTAAHPTETPTAVDADTVDLIGAPGNTYGGYDNRTTMTATVSYAPSSKLQFRFGGSYSLNTGQNTTTTANIFNKSRLPKYDNTNGFASAKMTYFINQTTYVTGNANYYFTNAVTYDPAFGEDPSSVALFGDSVASAKKGFTIRHPGEAFSAYSITLNGSAGIGELPGFNQPGQPVTGFAMTKQSGLGGRLDFTSQVTKKFEVKAGGEMTMYTYRRFAPQNQVAWAPNFTDTRLNPSDKSPTGALARALRNYGPNNIGYDQFGNEIENNIYYGGAVLELGPRTPFIGGAYVQSKIELQDIILNIGLRYDYISADVIKWKNPANLTFVDSLAAIRGENFGTTPTETFLSPRIGFSFPVTDRTQFYAQFGRFIQQPRLLESYRGSGLFYNIIKGGFFYQNPIGFGIRPEQTTQYEIGFQQQIADNASFDIAAFYKDTQDQLQYVSEIAEGNATHASYAAFQNGDFATVKGLEFKFTLRRTNRVQAYMNYTLSDARGTGSTPNAQAGAYGGSLPGGVFVPRYVVPLDFNQTHRGSISLDYRYGKGEGGKVLEQMGLNVLAQFNSGNNFTRLAFNSPFNAGDPRFRNPIEEQGASTTPWFFQIDLRLDKTFSLGKFDVNAYIYVINVLNKENAQFVYPRTGDPKDDGWFSIPEGRSAAQAYGTSADLYKQMYRTFNGGLNSGNFATPRQIRFGVKIEY